MNKYHLRNLKIYKRAIEFVVEVFYKISKSFPKEEMYGLRVQIRRLIISISLNIFKGSGNKSDKECQRFFEIAFRLKYYKKEDFIRLMSEAEEVASMASGFFKYLNSNLGLLYTEKL